MKITISDSMQFTSYRNYKRQVSRSYLNIKIGDLRFNISKNIPLKVYRIGLYIYEKVLK